MAGWTVVLDPGTLWAKLTERTAQALSRGALVPIETASEFVEQDGVRFLVRILASLARKDEARKAASGEAPNPFLPYEEALFVADVSPTHVCLLNKFNVIEHHLLVVTRTFEEQESPITLRDFEALWACMAEFEGLAFYNAGKAAGASQRHKHLQIVPLPLADSGPAIPIEPLLASARFEGPIGMAPGLPFAHALARLEPDWLDSPMRAAEATLGCYRALLERVGLHGGTGENGGTRLRPYNLLATRRWMLLVPRAQECFRSISINALGFAGALLVRNAGQMQLLKEHGPMNALKSVVRPPPQGE